VSNNNNNDGGGGGGGATLDGGAAANPAARNLDPRTLSRSCNIESDCTLQAIVTDCSSCCSQQPVNRAALAPKLAEHEVACSEGQSQCTMICPEQFVDCFNNECIACEGRPSCDDEVVIRFTVDIGTATGLRAFRATTNDGIKGTCEMTLVTSEDGGTARVNDCSEQKTGAPPYIVRIPSTSATSVTVDYVDVTGKVSSKSLPVTYTTERPTPGRCVKDECRTAKVDVAFP